MADETTRATPETAAAPPVATASDTIEQGVVEVDDQDRDDDPSSGDGDSDASGSFVSSINSSIMNYKYKNGRRYHAFREGAYLVPNDHDEQERMDMGHHIYMLVLKGELNLAPIGKDLERVLDLGTGTGIWAMDFADRYPSAEVLGTDLSPIQPKWTPPNCSFEVDDFEQEWMYKHKFDFIHGRELGGCVADPDVLFRRAYENLNPGCYFEFQIVYPRFVSDDGTAADATDAQLWLKNICEGAGKFGKPLDAAPTYLAKVKAAGFVDVQQDIRKIPIGAWPKDSQLKEIGRYQIVQEQAVIDSYTPGIFSQVLSWKEEEIQALIAKVKKDLTNPALHIYMPVYFIWGKKP